MRPLIALFLLTAAYCACAETAGSPKPIEIKVVVINMFEAGADTGDTPGEYQYWVEREHLDTVLPFPQGYHDLRINSRHRRPGPAYRHRDGACCRVGDGAGTRPAL